MSEDDLMETVKAAFRAFESAYEGRIDQIAEWAFDEATAKRITTREQLELWVREKIDADPFVTYTHFAKMVCCVSQNDGEGVAEGSVPPSEFDGGIPWSSLAFDAMERDVFDAMRNGEGAHGLDISQDDLGMEPEDEDE